MSCANYGYASLTCVNLCAIVSGMGHRIPIGTKIKRARERRRMRQQDLAALLGVTRATVDAWENDRSYPRSSLGALEEVLGITLTGDSGESPAVEMMAARAALAEAAETIAQARGLTARQRRRLAEQFQAVADAAAEDPVPESKENMPVR